MAKSKKKQASAKKQAAKKKTAKKKSAPQRKVARKPEKARLTADQKLRMHKPGPDLDEIGGAAADGLEATKAKVKVPGVSVAKLRGKLARAEKARARLAKEEAKAEAKLAPLRDAATLEAHEAWDLILGINKVKEAIAERHQDVRDAFASFDTLFANRYAGGGGTRVVEDGGGES
jgi:hypothetical protein